MIKTQCTELANCYERISKLQTKLHHLDQPDQQANPYEHGVFLTISEEKSQLKIEQNKTKQNPQAQASISDRLQLLTNGYHVWYRRTSGQTPQSKFTITKGGRTFTTVASAMSDMISNSNQNNSNQNKQTARGRGKSPVPAKAEEERIMTTLSVYIDGCGGKKGLLEGWSCKIVPRKQNTKKKSGYYKDSDTFFFSPDGKRLRTKSDVARFFGLIEEAKAKAGETKQNSCSQDATTSSNKRKFTSANLSFSPPPSKFPISSTKPSPTPTEKKPRSAKTCNKCHSAPSLLDFWFCRQCTDDYKIPSRHSLLGMRKEGFYGCDNCSWVPSGCEGCILADVHQVRGPQLPAGKIFAKPGVTIQQNFKDKIKIVKDSRQSDPNGVGLIARQFIAKGEEFIDHTAEYTKRPLSYAEAHLDWGDYISIERKSAYFIVHEPCLQRQAFTYFFNEANFDDNNPQQKANIKWKTVTSKDGGDPHLLWVAMSNIRTGEELLVSYC